MGPPWNHPRNQPRDHPGTNPCRARPHDHRPPPLRHSPRTHRRRPWSLPPGAAGARDRIHLPHPPLRDGARGWDAEAHELRRASAGRAARGRPCGNRGRRPRHPGRDGGAHPCRRAPLVPGGERGALRVPLHGARRRGPGGAPGEGHSHGLADGRTAGRTDARAGRDRAAPPGRAGRRRQGCSVIPSSGSIFQKAIPPACCPTATAATRSMRTRSYTSTRPGSEPTPSLETKA
jgi:hypothetical protein